MNDQSHTELTDTEHARLLQDLQHRIDTLHRADESRFGEFTSGDWILCVGGFLVIPYLLYLWFWP